VSAATLDATRDVLVVEDDDDVRESVTLLLEGDDVRVTGVANGREAMEYLGSKPAPCVIVLDLMMPHVTGWDLLRWLRRDPELAAIPVIIVSAAGPERVREAVRLHPAATYLQKPCDAGELLDAVAARCR
jgi:CheY-like chemotaxis protein